MDANSLTEIMKIAEQLGIIGAPALAVALVVYASVTRPKASADQPEHATRAEVEKIKEQIAALSSRVSYIEGGLDIK